MIRATSKASAKSKTKENATFGFLRTVGIKALDLCRRVSDLPAIVESSLKFKLNYDDSHWLFASLVPFYFNSLTAYQAWH